MAVPSEDEAWASRESARIAYHEAGHACAVWRIGATLERVVINPPDRQGRSLGSGGRVHHRGPAGVPHAEFIRRRLLMLYAGPEAQRQHDPASDVLRGGAGDYADAENLAAIGYASPETRAAVLRMAEREARSFVRAEWPCIDALAQALLRTPTLDGAAAIAVMRVAGAHRTARPTG